MSGAGYVGTRVSMTIPLIDISSLTDAAGVNNLFNASLVQEIKDAIGTITVVGPIADVGLEIYVSFEAKGDGRNVETVQATITQFTTLFNEVLNTSGISVANLDVGIVLDPDLSVSQLDATLGATASTK